MNPEVQEQQPIPVAAAVVGDRVHIRCPYADKDGLKQVAPAARWEPRTRTWSIPASPAVLQAVHGHFSARQGMTLDPAANAVLEAAGRAEDAQAIKEQTGLADLPTRTSAWEHQRQAFHFSVEGDLAGTMLAMDMGTGKTLTAIGLLEARRSNLTLIVCPRNVVGVWPKQFGLHAKRQYHAIAPPVKATVARRAAYVANQIALGQAKGLPVVVIVNYEAAWRPAMAKLLLATQWDHVILDESHRIKAPGGKASKFCHSLSRRAAKRMCLTGTPMPHSPLDIYAQYRFLDDSIFGTSFSRFRNRYAIMGGFEGRQVIDYQNEHELSKKFHSIAYVCKSDDVLDLPEYHHVTRTFQLGPTGLRAYNALDADLTLGVGEGTVTVANALTKLLRMQQVTSGFVRDDEGVDHKIDGEKADLLKEVLEDLPPGEPVVVFARFQHDLDTIASVCDELGIVHGELSGRKRDALTADSTMNPGIQVAIVQEQAGGVGIDLTRAAVCIFYSLSFSLGDFDQALKRVHRPGQDRKTLYIHLVAEGTKDEVVYEALQARRNVVEAVIQHAKENQ